MEFTLFYRGELKAAVSGKSRIVNKHELRRRFHCQLSQLWSQPPLSRMAQLTDQSTDMEVAVGTKPLIFPKLRSFDFRPLVSERIHLVADLRITLLRPGRAGSVIIQGGDIDNRLKTLFDALRMPSNEGELPADAVPDPEGQPFYCLLESDSLIRHVSVQTAQLLDPVRSPTECVLLVAVHTKATHVHFGNMELLG